MAIMLCNGKMLKRKERKGLKNVAEKIHIDIL